MFLASQCSACFYGERQLKHHIDEAHVRELKYVCDVCGQVSVQGEVGWGGGGVGIRLQPAVFSLSRSVSS